MRSAILVAALLRSLHDGRMRPGLLKEGLPPGRRAKAEAHLGPAPSTEGEEATVWYFAFGSNINKKVFQGRRMISPAESVPAVLPGWRLEFSQPGLPYAEPAFAAVERRQEGSDDGGACPLDVHGVAHRITPSQWAYVLETEGGSGGKEDHAYQVVEATAEAYDGRALGVVTLSVSPRVKARLQVRLLACCRPGRCSACRTPLGRREARTPLACCFLEGSVHLSVDFTGLHRPIHTHTGPPRAALAAVPEPDPGRRPGLRPDPGVPGMAGLPAAV